MQAIKSIEALEAHYGKVSPLAISKVCEHITPLYQRWIDASRFMILSTVGPSGTDASPRGDSDEVVRIVDAKTLWLPDWKGNNRLDSLKNIVEDGRVSAMFMVSGSDTVVRINGEAIVTADDVVTGAFERDGKQVMPARHCPPQASFCRSKRQNLQPRVMTTAIHNTLRSVFGRRASLLDVVAPIIQRHLPHVAHG